MTDTIPPPDLAADAAIEAADEQREREAGLDEARAHLIAKLKALGVVAVRATSTLLEGQRRISDIIATGADDLAIDLADTEPTTFGWGEDHQSYDSLLEFVADYMRAHLLYRPVQFLSDGMVELSVTSGDLFQPIDHVARHAADAAVVLKKLKADKAALIPVLKELGVVSVDIEYDGAGDEGQISGIYAYRADNSTVPLEQTAPITLGEPGSQRNFSSLHLCLDEFGWDVLGHHHAKFEDNHGGFGKIVLHVDEDKVTVEHNSNVQSSEYEEAEF